jgi:hypothetical protein
MIRRMLAGTGLVLGCSAVLAAETASNGGIDYTARTGLSYSDNIFRAPSDKEDSLALVAGLELSGSRPTGRLRYQADADVAFNEYLSNGIDSELLGNAALSGSYDFVPERFGWNAGLTYGQLRGDVVRPSAPGNREDILSLTTGPTARLQFSNVAELQLTGNYARQTYSDRPFDNETIGGRASLARRISPRSSVSAGFSFDDVSYVGSNAPSMLDYERKEIFGRVDLQGVRSDVQVEAGRSNITGELVDSGGFFMRANLSRRLTPAVTGFLRAVREYPTSTETYGPGFEGGEVVEDTALLTSGPRKTTDLQAGLRFGGTRTNASLTASRREEASLVENVGKRKLNGVHGEVSRALTPRANGSFYVSLSDEEFTAFAGSAEETTIGMRLGINSGRTLGFEARVEYRDRGSGGVYPGYSEFSGGVFLTYRDPDSSEE